MLRLQLGRLRDTQPHVMCNKRSDDGCTTNWNTWRFLGEKYNHEIEDAMHQNLSRWGSWVWEREVRSSNVFGWKKSEIMCAHPSRYYCVLYSYQETILFSLSKQKIIYFFPCISFISWSLKFQRRLLISLFHSYHLCMHLWSETSPARFSDPRFCFRHRCRWNRAYRTFVNSEFGGKGCTSAKNK